MQHVGRVAFFPGCLIETGLIFVNEPLCGQGSIDEDHARELLPPALRIDARLHAAQRMPDQHIRSGYGPGFERRVQVIDHFGKDLRPGRRITEAIRGAVEGADARLLRDHGLGLVPDQ